jgi:rhodanese-related sulfurtransferase
MDRLFEFATNNVILFVALAVVLVLIVVNEIKRFTRGFREVSPTETVQLINHENALLLDVRESNELASGTIAGSRHIAMSALKQRMGELAEFVERPVVIVCKTGARSLQACETLRKANFTNVACLKGGIEAWRNASLPIKKK